MPDFQRGDCFQLKDHSGKHHLHIVLGGPMDEPPTILTVIVNTAHDYNIEHNYVLEPGDHSFVKRRSVVNYGSARLIYVRMLHEAESLSQFKSYDDQIFRHHTAIEHDLLIGILQGALESKATKREIKAELRRRTPGLG